MLTTKDEFVELTTEANKSLDLTAACANLHLSVPGPNDTFTLEPAFGVSEASRLAAVLAKSAAEYATRQAAVWIVTGNASRSELGTLQRGRFQSAIGPFNIALAMRLVEWPGIDIIRKRIWDSRNEILEALSSDKSKSEISIWLKSRIESRP
jgi:hypothetical protein